MGGFPGYNQPMSMMGAQPPAQEKKAKKSKGGAPTEQKRRITGVLAIVLAVLGGIFVLNSLNAQKSEGMVYILRAKANILPLTPITESQLEAAQIPAEAVEPGALKATTPEAVLEAARAADAATTVVGKYALYPILAKQQIRIPSMLSADAQLRVELADDERLVTINVPLARGVAGLIRSGDRVDVYNVAGDNGGASSQLLAEDIEVVLAAPGEDVVKAVGEANPGQDPLTRLPSYPVPQMYVLRVPVSLVTTMISADSTNSLYLAYRPVANTTPDAPANDATDDPAASPTTSTAPAPRPSVTAAPATTPADE